MVKQNINKTVMQIVNKLISTEAKGNGYPPCIGIVYQPKRPGKEIKESSR